ncbi:hypothetical protein [Kutzneria buriramensis]|uniref:Polyketide cyclase/dehydrase/lipid transport protein n=1 Tax=Kutzneria buriramensis TaxID=1045776 RepID=A0A3E0GWM7_9PSEU|nr:hypothetical protein [Kutzneria buriramensis]REH32534.1 hypothetical protein BCF44_12182 [Kutzneria buriramensis]
MELPFIDEHREPVAAPAAAVWAALVEGITRSLGTSALSAVLGTEPRRASGGPFETGSTLPGFAAAEVVPEQLIRLVGRHRFSHYELIFTLTEEPGGTVLAARSLADFPGLLGSVYRALVISSGAHRQVVGRMLKTIRRHAEARP